MENWGLVTYTESDFLYEEGTSSVFEKEGIAKLIAHELAHQVCPFKVVTFSSVSRGPSHLEVTVLHFR